MYELQMKIYNHSPITVQNMLVSLIGLKRNYNWYGNGYRNVMAELESRDFSDAEGEQRYQEQEIQRLIQHAVSNSSFYKEFYKDVDISSIRSVEDLQKLPILTKDMVRENVKQIYTVNESEGVISYTSGTSGKPLKVLYTKEDLQKRMAFLDFFKKQHGVHNLTTKRASFSDNRFIPQHQRAPVYWRDNLFLKQRLYSAHYCQPQHAEKLVRNLDSYQPESMDGLPSAMYELAKWINENEYRLSFQPKAIFTTAETLYPYYRKEIEKAFNCKIRDQYASSEGAPFIAECSAGKLHYNMATGVIETTETGEMVVTCFHTYGTPLIRYCIGDEVQFADNKERCACGSSHPIVRHISGRTDDFLFSKSKGRFTSVHLSFISEKFDGEIRNMQFRQDEVSKIDVLVEAGSNYKEEFTPIIKDELEYFLGEEMKINIQVVEKIPRGSNNKFRLIINNLPKTGITFRQS